MFQTVSCVLLIVLIIGTVVILSEDLKDRVDSSSFQEECFSMCPDKNFTQDISTSDNNDYYMIQNLKDQHNSDNNLIVRNKINENVTAIISTISNFTDVPSKPTLPRVFVEFDKELNKKEKNISVIISIIFRWGKPDFGVIERYTVQCWYIENLKNIQIVDEIVPVEVFEHKVKNLKSNTTYYFQVRAHTKISTGPYTDLINVSTTHENPIPRLMITSSDGLMVLDMDLKTTIELSQYYEHDIKEIVYSALERDFYYINKMQELKVRKTFEVMKIVNLDVTAQNLCIDWVARKLYWIQKNGLLTNIIKLDITLWEFNVLVKQSVKYYVIQIRNNVKFLNVLPSMGLLYWIESTSDDHDQYVIMQSDLDGKNVQSFLREENDTCYCPFKLLKSSSILQIDNTNIEKPLMYWTWNDRLIVADIYGCRCNQILSAENDEIFTHLTIDKTNVYLFNNMSEQLIYILNKNYVFLEGKENAFKHVNVIQNFYINNIYRIIAISRSVQPYPSTLCLIPKKKYEDNYLHYNVITAVTANRIVMNAPKSVPNYKCEQYNLATVIYKSSIKEYLTGITIKVDLQTSEKYLVMSYLKSCTEYILTLEMLNFYSRELLLDPVKMETLVRTEPDKFNPPENVTVQVLTPTFVAVYWTSPKKMNCAPMKYEVHWKLVSFSNNSQQINKQLYEDNYIIIDKPKRTVDGKFHTKIQSLLPSQKYLLYVRVYPANYSKFYSDSWSESFYMYSEPNNLTFREVSANSMNISWIPNINFTIDYVLEYKNVTMQVWQIANSTEINNNEVIYHIENLLPCTLYKFRLLLKYPKYEEDFTWPSDEGLSFPTLDDLPTAPGIPTITKLPNLTYQLYWESAQSHDSQVILYQVESLTIKSNYNEKDNQTDGNEQWNVYYNGIYNYWIIKNMNQKYRFRVRAKNSCGFGVWSEISAVIDLTESVDILSSQYYLLLTLTFVAFIIIICVCYFYHLYRQFRKGKGQILCPIIRNIELVPLYEIPHENVQLNALYVPMLQYNLDEIPLITIRIEQIVLTKRLGSGAFGEVFQGIVKNFEGLDTTSVAIKRLRKNASTQEKKQFLDEAKIMSNFRHKHVLKLIGICLDKNSPLLILELMEDDLLQYLKKSRTLQSSDPHTLRLQDLLAMCEDVARGCCYLEKLHFVHRDLACRNCLISTQNRESRIVKIGDFGLAKDIYRDDYYRMKGKGSLPFRWMAPESLINGIFSSKSDVWAFGVLMWEITSLGERPYPARTNLEVSQYVCAGGRLSKPLNCPLMLYQLMMRCWSAADDRPNFKVCLENIIDLKSNIEDAALSSTNITWAAMENLGNPAILQKVESTDLSSNSQTGIKTYKI